MKLATNTRTILGLTRLRGICSYRESGRFADDMKVPTTSGRTQALAKQYQDEAVQSAEKVADDRRAMAGAYKKTIAMPVTSTGRQNPYLGKWRGAGRRLKDADKLAADATKAADFQTARAKELEGK